MLYFRREALEAAISEKDAHLALIEMSGIRSSRQAREAEQLRTDKRRLVEKLKQEVNLFDNMHFSNLLYTFFIADRV